MTSVAEGRVLQQREAPWYQLGTTIDAPVSVHEALTLSGLDYDVVARPSGFQRGDGSWATVPDKYRIVREDDEAQVFGEVGRNYKIFQNRDVFAFADGLVSGGLLIDACGEYRNRKRVFLVAKLPEHVQVLGEDPYGVYLFLVTSHDGTMAMTACVVQLRFACTNQFPMALRTAKTKWSIPHVATADGRMKEARESLALTMKATDAFAKEMEQIACVPISELELTAAVEKVLPETKHRGEKVDQILGLFRESPNLEPYRGTRYAALQAFGEWMDWGRDVKTDEARFQVSFDGYGASQRNRLYQLLSAS